MDNKNQIKQDSGLSSRPLTYPVDAPDRIAERITPNQKRNDFDDTEYKNVDLDCCRYCGNNLNSFGKCTDCYM